MNKNLEKEFEEIKAMFKEALDNCKTAEQFRFFLGSIMEVIINDYRNIIMEQKLSKIIEKIDKEENEKM